MKASVLFPLVFTIFAKVSATPLEYGLDAKVCDGAVTLASIWIGEGKDVEMKSVYCPNLYQPRDDVQHALEQPQTAPDVCGAPCFTTCFTPAGGGPDPNECHVIADALRFDSQAIGIFFTTSSKSSFFLKFSSCSAFFFNQTPGLLTYCRTDFAALIDFIAPNCQATQNAHGGICVKMIKDGLYR